MRPRAELVAAAALAIGIAPACAGCSLLFGLDAKDYTGGDAGAHPPGDAARDAPDDGLAADDGARGDGADAADAASPGCVGSHVFCDDFDGPGTLQDRGWTVYTSGSGAVTVDGAASRSPPKSLLAVGSPGDRATAQRAFASLDPTDLELAFDLLVESSSATDGVILGSVGVGTYGVRFGMLADGSYVVDEWDGQANHELPNAHVLSQRAPLAQPAWVHVDLRLHFVKNQQPGSRITLAIDGATLLDAAASPTVGDGGVGISLGDTDAPNETLRVRFDDVALD